MTPERSQYQQNGPETGLSSVLASLVQSALHDLRTSRGGMRPTKRAVLRYLSCGLQAGISFDRLLEELMLKPILTTSVFARIGYSSREMEGLISWIRELTPVEVLASSLEQTQ